MSEDDYSLAIQSSRDLLQQINSRRRKSQYQRQYPRHRSQDTARSVDRLAQGLHRQNLKQKHPLRQTNSPLRTCANSESTPSTTVSKPSATHDLDEFGGNRREGLGDEGTSQFEGEDSSSPWTSTWHTARTKSKPSSADFRRSWADTTPTPDDASYNIYQRPLAQDTAEIGIPQLLEADSDDAMDDDEGFSGWPNDLLKLGEESNEAMNALGAYRRRGLLRFRRSTEAASRCPVVVRNVPRMRRRKQKKMEVRLRAATTSDTQTPSYGDPMDPV